MDKSARQGAQRKPAVLHLVTERQLAAILKSRKGDGCIARLAETLRQAWARIVELEQAPEDTEQRERDWQTCERVLVTSDTDGAVEVFAESWVSVKHIEVTPWDEKDELIAALSAEWQRLYEAPKSRCLIVPQIRPKLDDEALVNLAKWHDRVGAFEALLKAIPPTPIRPPR